MASKSLTLLDVTAVTGSGEGTAVDLSDFEAISFYASGEAGSSGATTVSFEISGDDGATWEPLAVVTLQGSESISFGDILQGFLCVPFVSPGAGSSLLTAPPPLGLVKAQYSVFPGDTFTGRVVALVR